MKKTIKTFLLLFCVLLAATASKVNAQSGDYYQIRVYHLANEQQQQVVENFLQNAYLPAVHKAGIKKSRCF